MVKRDQCRMQYKLNVDNGLQGNANMANISKTLVIFVFIKYKIDMISSETGGVYDRWKEYIGGKST